MLPIDPWGVIRLAGLSLAVQIGAILLINLLVYYWS
jgi:hypothetical protein